ncbi:MAG: hypothetical protein IPK67_20640 [Planctomycetes bacterium]|nr:hypothetical protein [Planctomycetota bacterium]
MANGAHLRHVVVPEKALARARLPGVESWADVPDHDRVVPIIERHEEAYRQIDFVGGFTAASGCCVYDGGAWPAEYEGRIYVAEPTVNLVHEDVLSPKGATFTATKSREQEFLASADLWFRPVHMRVGPEGAYTCSISTTRLQCTTTRAAPSTAHQRRLAARPRPHPRPDLARAASRRDGRGGEITGADGAGLVAALKSPNGWRRGTALRLLCEDVPRMSPRNWRESCRGTGQHDGLRGGALGARPVGQAGR